MASNAETFLASKGPDTLRDYHCAACQELEAQFHSEECCNGFCASCVKLQNQLYKTHTMFGRERMEKWPIASSMLEFLEVCSNCYVFYILLYE
ncbi:hypothetical protein DPMN_184423 [Dreissena polymorpha]|uniref:Uncharacterized protein n=1 Tax=Dreissena polymorpha TaxID=45954 RepID=A0A9D4DJ46_DREPO|nr:hypothetical protein DPMN_184423 [Dreissena polymorpha]